MTNLNGKATNPQDPLWQDAPSRVEHLTKEFGRVAHLYSTEDVINAAAGILVTALRQSYKTKAEAEARYDEIFGRMKTIFLGHYDSISGRKKGIFPFDQEIKPGLMAMRSIFPGINIAEPK